MPGGSEVTPDDYEGITFENHRLMDPDEALRVYQNLTGETDPNIWDSSTADIVHPDGRREPMDIPIDWDGGPGEVVDEK